MNRYLLHTPRTPLNWNRPVVGMRYKTDKIWTIEKIDDGIVWAKETTGEYSSANRIEDWWNKWGRFVIHE